MRAACARAAARRALGTCAARPGPVRARAAARRPGAGKDAADAGQSSIEFRALEPALGARAAGAIVAQQGETVVHATCVVDEAPQERVDFAPITVVYREKAFAAGRIARTFTRREFVGKENEILAGRAIDRSLRPLFPEGLQNAVQIICTVWAADGKHDPEVLAINAASAATALAGVPWKGPLGAARVSAESDPSETLLALQRGDEGPAATESDACELYINSAKPEHHDAGSSWLNLVVAGLGGGDKITMLEGSARELQADVVEAAIDYVQPEIEASVAAQNALVSMVRGEGSQPPARAISVLQPSQELHELAARTVGDLVDLLFTAPHETKQERGKAQSAFWKVASDLMEKACAETSISDAVSPDMRNVAIHDALRDGIARAALGKHEKSPKRIDGRGIKTLRRIEAEVDVLPSAHGSAVFARGGTQVVCTATVGPSKLQKQLIPTVGNARNARAMLQYDFPPYCVNRTGRTSGLNRRMVGHGNLAERGVLPILAPVLDSASTYPFAIHVGSEVTGSDGSSSMATATGASLALMDAGVPISRPAAGISVGLFVDPKDDSSFCIPVDILGLEDHFGGMDFKVCGTKQGFTAFQVDIKRPFISKDIVRAALNEAHGAHHQLIDSMCASAKIAEPRAALKSKHWSIERVRYPQEVLSNQGLEILRDIEDKADVFIEVDETRRILTIFAPTSKRSAIARDLIRQRGFADR